MEKRRRARPTTIIEGTSPSAATMKSPNSATTIQTVSSRASNKRTRRDGGHVPVTAAVVVHTANNNNNNTAAAAAAAAAAAVEVIDLIQDSKPKHTAVAPFNAPKIAAAVNIDLSSDILQVYTQRTGAAKKMDPFKDVISLLDDDDSPAPLPSKKMAASLKPAAIPNPMTAFVPTLAKPTYKYDYSSTSATLFPISPPYIQQALLQLNHDFPWLHQRFLTLILPKFHGRFSYLYDSIVSCFVPNTQIMASSHEAKELSYQSMREFLFPNTEGKKKKNKFCPTTTFTTHFQQVILSKLASPSSVSWLLASPRSSSSSPVITHEILLEEVQYMHLKWKHYQNSIQHEIHLHSLRQEAEKQGTTLECQCCFSNVAMEEMVSCLEEGHLFCMECIQRHVEERVFGFGSFQQDKKKTRSDRKSDGGEDRVGMDVTCMHGDGCTSTFPYSQLERCLPPKVLEKYNELQCHVVLEKAGLHNLGKCPQCGFQALVPDQQRNFYCPILTCQFKSCRQCGEPTHDPIPCDQVEKKNDTAARLKVEEAMSEARIRTCPKCSRKFYKQEGCNKMTCSCGTLICYICRKVITGYTHFCQKPHCRHKDCNGCPLFTTAGEDADMAAVREAGMKAVAQIEKSEVNQNQQPNMVWKTSVDQLLKTK